MLVQRNILNLLAILVLLALQVACLTPDAEQPQQEEALQEEVVSERLPEGKADEIGLPLTPLLDVEPAQSALIQEARRTITTPAAFQRAVGRPAPASLDFNKEWVVFYTAGRKSTGGFEASIDQVRLAATGRSLQIATSLTTAGAGCNVTFAESTPYSLVTFPKPNLAQASVRYYATTQAGPSCLPATTCDEAAVEAQLASFGAELWFTSEGDEPLDLAIWGGQLATLADQPALLDLLQEPNIPAAYDFGGGEAAGTTARAVVSESSLERVVRSLFIWRDDMVIELTSPHLHTIQAESGSLWMHGVLPGQAIRYNFEHLERYNGNRYIKYPEIFQQDGSVREDAKQVKYGDEIDRKGMRFSTGLMCRLESGQYWIENGKIIIQGADRVELYLVTGSSFNGFDRSPSCDGRDEKQEANENLMRIEGKTWEELEERAVKDHAGYFQRVSFHLGDDQDQKSQATDERIQQFNGKNDL